MRSLTILFILLLSFVSFSQEYEPEEADSTSTTEERADSETQTAPSSAEITSAQPPTTQESETTVSEIVVTARFSYCDPEIMRKKLPSEDAILSNFVKAPGFQLGNEPTRNPNFFNANWKSAHINNINYLSQKMKIFASYLLCTNAECEKIISENPNLTLEQELRYNLGNSEKFRNYTVSGEVEFSQMYDAKFEDVEVSCPLNTCQGIEFYGPQNRNFYTATRVGDHIERKLVVNGGLNSRFITGPTGTSLERCPPVEPPEQSVTRGRRR